MLYSVVLWMDENKTTTVQNTTATEMGYCVPTTCQACAKHVTHTISYIKKSLHSKHHYLHFTDQETKAQRNWLNLPRLPSKSALLLFLLVLSRLMGGTSSRVQHRTHINSLSIFFLCYKGSPLFTREQNPFRLEEGQSFCQQLAISFVSRKKLSSYDKGQVEVRKN